MKVTKTLINALRVLKNSDLLVQFLKKQKYESK